MSAIKKIVLLGATGTIGQQTLDVIAAEPEAFQVVALTAQRQWQKLADMARVLQPQVVAIADESFCQPLKEALSGTAIRVLAGEAGVCEAASVESDIVMAGIVGLAGLRPALAAIPHTKAIALANKECLVAAGPLFLAACKKHNVSLLPVDSEHNAIFQVWDEAARTRLRKIILTASGGPFRAFTAAQLQAVQPEQALKHPVWAMGAKITIDSATLMNKGLELIEAQHLFGVRPDQLDVLVHPEAFIHGLVEFTDGAVLAQMAVPDMRTPIGYCLHYPKRAGVVAAPVAWEKFATLSLTAPDRTRFPCLALAENAMRASGYAPVVLNAANEVAVAAFLEKRIGFMDIPALVAAQLEQTPQGAPTSLADVLAADHETRARTCADYEHKTRRTA